jgi:hypothetical protein
VRVVYLAHALSAPTREGIEANRARGARWAAWILKTYRVAVIADWIWCTGELEETQENRTLGLAMDVELVSRADEVWLVGERISEGMRIEATQAFRLGKMVFDLTAYSSRTNEPPAGRLTTDFIMSRQWQPENEGRGGGELRAIDEDEDDTHVIGGEG